MCERDRESGRMREIKRESGRMRGRGENVKKGARAITSLFSSSFARMLSSFSSCRFVYCLFLLLSLSLFSHAVVRSLPAPRRCVQAGDRHKRERDSRTLRLSRCPHSTRHHHSSVPRASRYAQQRSSDPCVTRRPQQRSSASCVTQYPRDSSTAAVGSRQLCTVGA